MPISCIRGSKIYTLLGFAALTPTYAGYLCVEECGDTHFDTREYWERNVSSENVLVLDTKYIRHKTYFPANAEFECTKVCDDLNVN
jgi:hypothetical protein